jgi:hypothetical protein
MHKPINNETRLINEIWQNSGRELNERRQNFKSEPAPSTPPRPKEPGIKADNNVPVGEYDIDSLDLSAYTPEEQAEIKKQLKAVNFRSSIQSLANPGSIPAANQDDLQTELRLAKNIAVDNTGKTWYISDAGKDLVRQGSISREPSIYKPNPTSSEQPMDAATKQFNTVKKYKNMFGANWAELTADALDRAKKFVGPPKPSDEERNNEEGSSVEISAEDLDSGEPIAIDLRGSLPKIAKPEQPKSQPEFPHWGESPHGYDPTTPEDADAAQKWRDRYNKELDWAKSKGLSVDDAAKHAEGVMAGETPKGVSPEASERLKNLGFKPEQIPSTTLPSRDQAMDDRWKQIITNMERNWETKQTSSPITQTGGPRVTPGFTPTPFGQIPGKLTPVKPSEQPKSQPEFPHWGESPHGYDPTTPEDAVAEYKKSLDSKVDKGTVSSSDLKMPYSERSPEPEALSRTPIKWPSEKPAPLPSAPVGSGILTPEEQDKAQRAAQKSAGYKEDLRKAVEAAKDVARKSSPSNSTYPDLVDSIKKGEQLLGGTPTSPVAAPTPRTTSGRETGLGKDQTAVQPDQTWDEVATKFIPDQFKNLPITRRDGKVYAGDVEMTAASQETSHYASNAPTRKQLQETVVVNRYANFITEMAKKAKDTKPATKPAAKSATKPATKPAAKSATKPDTKKKETEITPAPSVATPTPAVAIRPIPATAVRPVHGGRSSTTSTTPTPVVAPEKTTENPPITGSSTAFPKLPKDYKGNVKYKVKELEVNPYTSPTTSSDPYFTPQSAPLSPLERYVGPSRFPSVGSMDYSYLQHATKEPYSIISPKSPPQIETKSSTGIPGPTTKSFGQNIISSTGKKIGVGAMGAVLATAATIAIRGGQPNTPAKTGAATPVNTQNTPNTQETQQQFSQFEMKLRKSSGFR